MGISPHCGGPASRLKVSFVISKRAKETKTKEKELKRK